ncbi:MAG: hypothetical protein JXK93_11495 [Sphaerochaetaceae bacterium]|nr:hypothetical protein [Sphaerochaetaceae bacterium]
MKQATLIISTAELVEYLQNAVPLIVSRNVRIRRIEYDSVAPYLNFALSR